MQTEVIGSKTGAFLDYRVKLTMRLDGVFLNHGARKLVSDANAAFGAAGSDDLAAGRSGHPSAETGAVGVFDF